MYSDMVQQPARLTICGEAKSGVSGMQHRRRFDQTRALRARGT